MIKILVLLTVMIMLSLGAIQLVSAQEMTCCCDPPACTAMNCACGGTPPPTTTPPPTVSPCTCADGYYSADCNCAGHETLPPPSGCSCPDGYYSTNCDCSAHQQAAGCQCTCGWSATCSCATMCPTLPPPGTCSMCPDGYYPNYASDPLCSCSGHTVTGTTPTTGCQCTCGWSATCSCATMCPTLPPPGTCSMCPDGYYPNYASDPTCSCTGHQGTTGCTSPNYRCADGSCSVNNACPGGGMAAGCQCSCGWSATCNCGTMCPAGGGVQCSCGWKYDETKDCATWCAAPGGAAGYSGCPSCDAANVGFVCSSTGSWVPPCGTGAGCQCSCGWSFDCRCATLCPTSGGYIPPAGTCPSPEYKCGDGSCSVGSKCGCYCGDGRWSPDCNCGTSGTATSCGPAEYRCGDGSCSMNGMCRSMVAATDGCPGCDQYGPGYNCAGRWIPSCGRATPTGGMNCGDCPKCDYSNIGYDCHGCWVPSCASMTTGGAAVGTAACGSCKDCTWPDMWGRCPESMMATTTQAGGGCTCYDGTNRESCERCPVPPPGWVPPSDFKPATPMMLYDQYGRPKMEGQPAQPQPPMVQPTLMPKPVYKFEFKCPDMAQGEKACMEAKGKPITKLDPSGCPFIECDFMGMATTGSGFMKTQMMTACPSPEEMSSVKAKCESMGLKAVVERMGDCNFVKCAGQGLAENYCQRGLLPGPERTACEAEGKQTIMQVTENGCPVQKCIATAEAEQFCQKEADIQGAFKECTEKQGGEPAVRYSDNGCVEFYDCVVRGDERQVKFEAVTEVPNSAKILSAVLKLEKLKIQFNELSKEIQKIADYYDGEGQTAEAEKFHRAAGMIQASQGKITGIKAELKARLDKLTVDDIVRMKRDIKYVTEVIFKDVAYVILAETATETVTEETVMKTVTGEQVLLTKEGIDCGRDVTCFEKNFRICKAAKFMPAEEQFPPTVKISGIETKKDGTEACVLQVSQEMAGSMTCKIPDYAFAKLDPQSLLPYCEGEMADFMKKSEMKREGTDKVGMMGCAAVERGLATRGQCGNGCCEENYGESFETCGIPRGDCMPKGEFDFKMCTDNDKTKWKDCEAVGGRPQSNPRPDGTCEVFTSCMRAEQIGMMPMETQTQMAPMEYKPAIGQYMGACAALTEATRGQCGNGCCEPNIGESYETCGTPEGDCNPGPMVGTAGGPMGEEMAGPTGPEGGMLVDVGYGIKNIVNKVLGR